MRLKKHYSSREVADLTGLTARQLQWWDQRGIFAASIRPHRTEAGGFSLPLYLRHREWQAGLGYLAILAWLVVRYQQRG